MFFTCAKQCVFFFILFYYLYVSNVKGYSKNFNNSEEIKNIFESVNLPKKNVSLLADISRTGNFAEGGLVNIKSISNHSYRNIETISHKPHDNLNYQSNSSILTAGKSNSTTPGNVVEKSEINTTPLMFLEKSSAFTKLNDTNSNSFLGMPEVIHFNGISSIKPRKGVYYNKIVPRKGVDINELNHTLSLSGSCLWLTSDQCYVGLDFSNTTCDCCKTENQLAKVVQQQPLLSCKHCKPVNALPLKSNSSCQNICCYFNSCNNNFNLTDYTEKLLNNSCNNMTELKENNETQVLENFQSKNLGLDLSEKTDAFQNYTAINVGKKLKAKPTVTKVPYDVIGTEFLNKDRLVPIVIIILLLPLLGVIIFILWRCTKEYRDKRYYKRIDFLIDGMYND